MQSLKESTVTACLSGGGMLIPAERNSRRLGNWKCEHHGSSSVESATAAETDQCSFSEPCDLGPCLQHQPFTAPPGPVGLACGRSTNMAIMARHPASPQAREVQHETTHLTCE